MSGGRRHKYKKNSFATPDWASAGVCSCGKKVYRSKKDARNAARIKHPDDQLSVYQCMSNVSGPWHIGHLADEIKTGLETRKSRYRDLTPIDRCVYLDVNTPSTGFRCSLEEEHLGPHLALNGLGEWVNITLRSVERKQDQGVNEYGTNGVRDRSG